MRGLIYGIGGLFLLCISNTKAQNPSLFARCDTLQAIIDQALLVNNYKMVQDSVDQISLRLSDHEIMADRLSQLLTSKGTALRKSGNFDKSLLSHRRALQIRQSSCSRKSFDVANSLLNIGNVHWEMNQLDSAEAYYNNAKSILLSIVSKDAEELIPVYNGLGNIYLARNQSEEAGRNLKRAFSIAQSRWSNQPAKLTPYALNLANYHQSVYQSNQAEELLQNTLFLHHRSILKDYSKLGDLHNNLGIHYAQQQNLERALTHSDSALFYYEQLVQIPTKDYGNCLQNAGLILLNNGDLNRAIVYFNAALDHVYSYPYERAAILQNLGLVYLYSNRFEIAEDTLIAAFEAYRESGLNMESQDLAGLYLNLGNCYLRKAEPDLISAEFYFKDAVNSYSQHLDSPEYLKSLHQLAKCYLLQKQYNKASSILSETEERAKDRFPVLYSSSLFHQAEIAIEIEAYSLAERLLNSALEESPPEFIHFQTRIFTKLAILHQSIKNWEKALSNAQLGIDLLSNLKHRLTNPKSTIDLNQDFYQLYDIALEACYNLQSQSKSYKSLAFQFSEQFKSQVLKKYSTQYQNLGTNDSIAGLERQLANLKTKSYILSNAKNSANQAIADLNSQQTKLEQVLALLYQNHSADADLNFDYQEIQTKLKEPQSLLSYHWGDQNLFVFLIQSDTFGFFRIPNISRIQASIQRLFNCSNQRIEQQSITFQQEIYQKVVEEAQFLYNCLIKPFDGTLTEELLVVPDGLLSLIPFDLLIEKPSKEARLFRNHQYLLAKHCISYLYPASEIQFWDATEVPKGQVLTIAPTFDKTITGLEPLFYNVQEVNQVIEIVSGQALIQQAATEDHFKSIANQFDILHLSTHGILNHQNPEFSYIAFQYQDDAVENENLFVSEIEHLELDVDLVVLSACQSALGRLYRGEGLLSMARAFRLAGAQSLIASLWNVDDHQTPEMMSIFYESLAKGHSKSKALQQAKLQYIRSSSHFEAYPFYWAGFVLHGNQQPMNLKRRKRFWDWWG